MIKKSQNSDRFRPIAIILKSNERTANNDRNIFEQYCNLDISLDTCIKEFKKSNQVNPKYNIDPLLFNEWLISIGYDPAQKYR